MPSDVRRRDVVVEKITHEGGLASSEPFVEVRAAVVVGHPPAGHDVVDLSTLIEPSSELACELGRRAVELLGGRAVEGLR